MKFSEVHKIATATLEKADWFDPILDADTELFIDPFLVYKSKHPVFRGAQDQIVSFFEHAFRLAANLSGETDERFPELVRLLEFPEVREICLGYSKTSIKGLGTGETYAADIAAAVIQSIDMAAITPEHFEVISLLQEGIGPDRISDMTANLLKERLITYTQDTCKALGIPMSPFKMLVFDFGDLKWKRRTFDLPGNPCSSGNRAVLLVPHDFLGLLPTINTVDFGNFLWGSYQETLKEELSYDLKSQLRAKRNIIQVVKVIRDSVRGYQTEVEGRQPRPYDLATDPKGLYRWDTESRGYTEAHPVHLSTPRNDKEVLSAILALADSYKNCIEGGLGRHLLWHLDRPKSQEAARRVFQGVAVKNLLTNGVSINRPDYWGRRPVTLTFPNGKDVTVFVVIKLLRNTRSVDSFERTAERYRVTLDIKSTLLVLVGFTEEELGRAAAIQSRVNAFAEKATISARVVVVNATQGGPPINLAQ